MATPFQAAPLVASPSYPNSIAWSEENLIAVASGHLITILNPASIVYPRGLITLPPHKTFPIGRVREQELGAPCLMRTCLSRDTRPCVRSISWSPVGFAPNSGCLLAVCTTEGRVKIYRPPFCEFRSEWVEVVDISDLMFNYLDSINFGETIIQECAENGNAIGLPLSVAGKVDKKKKRKHQTEVALQDSSARQNSLRRSKRRLLESEEANDVLPQITAEQYSSRSVLLSSLIVAWSPVLQSHSNDYSSSVFYGNCAILAVGEKSGKIYFWRIYEPPCYTIEHDSVCFDPVLIGHLQAHNSWVTAISWGISNARFGESQLVLVTGSYDGRVKIWVGDVVQLMKSAKPNKMCFSLLKEVTAAISIAISTISLVVPTTSPDMVVLAIGKGSGSIEAWICHISNSKFLCLGTYDAHDQVVTGLTWAFEGHCLYSCSQDNCVRSWVLYENSLCEAFFPCSGGKNLKKHLQVSDPCFGLTVSPGSMVIALVRSFDPNLLNPMYQARIEKAAVEFFWISGQSLAIPSDGVLQSHTAATSDSSENHLTCWESNMLWSLKGYENAKKLLVLWDFIEAFQFFRKSSPSVLENVLVKWISGWFAGFEYCGSIEMAISYIESMLSKISSRKMHVLNIICRKMMLINEKANVPHGVEDKSNSINDAKETSLWNKLLMKIEHELRERLVAFTFNAVLHRVSSSASVSVTGTNWLPVGVWQMEEWVANNADSVQSQLKLLQSKLRDLGSSDYTREESCCFCSAPVSFKSPEVALCEGNKCNNKPNNEQHQLARCAVSMQLCSITTPMWFCICCKRWVAKLIPQEFFSLSKSPLDGEYDSESHRFQGPLRPLCPFCGILLQRLLPDFLLSASPV